MKHIVFDDSSSFHSVILLKENALHTANLKKYYLSVTGTEGFLAMSLAYNEHGKAPKKFILSYLGTLLKALNNLKVQNLIVTDAAYFKALTGAHKVDSAYGSFYKCIIKGYEHFDVTYTPSHTLVFYKPESIDKIDFCMRRLKEKLDGSSDTLGSDIVHFSKFVSDPNEIKECLNKLHSYDKLTVDIEAFSLKFWEAHIATITFCWSQHEGIVIACDINDSSTYKDNWTVRVLLRKFFDEYKGTTVYHGSTYDLKVLIFELYMQRNFFDKKGMFLGIDTLTSNIEDTKLICYLATNSTTRNHLGLKYVSQEYTGDYAENEIDDITKIPLHNLMHYNLIDGLATFHVLNKYYPIMVQDDQLNVYETIFKPSIPVILQMELTGLPINMEKVKEAKKTLMDIRESATESLLNNPYTKEALKILRQKEFELCHSKWKTKTAPIEYFDYVLFKPSSSDHIAVLLYDVMSLPIEKYTPTGKPSTKKKDISHLVNYTKDEDSLEAIKSILDLADVDILLDNFINAFENKSILKSDGWYYLHGNFNLGGTVSGRLSSSGPNLQNIPSTGSKYSKLIKMCIEAPPGYLFTGADFSSLEDRISALTTKDKNKLKVYTDGYDGHCLRAYYYFQDQMPDINENPDSINSIENLYPHLRQDSKAPTFLLTYGGTYHGMMKNLGWSEEKSKKIEEAYHSLYADSDAWVQAHIENAHQTGYVTCAFGLRVRTPILKQTIYGSSKLPYEASKEQRTAGNALGQSWGLLNNRAAIELFQRLKSSPYREHINPVAHIHDAQYFTTLDDVDVIDWLNTNLIDCMQWQNDPLIQHSKVKLGGELSIFYPDWSKEIKLPNSATKSEIIKIARENI